MSKPSSFNGRPSSSATVPRKQSNNNLISSDKISRQLSNISIEGYHRGEPVSVPFTWESQPGTSKVKLKEASLPPLSPPPSYYSSTPNNRQISKQKKHLSKPNLLKAIFPKRNTRKGNVPSLTCSPSSSLSSSSSSSSSYSYRKTSYSVPSSPMVSSRKDKQDEDLYDIPASSLCFGNAGSRGYYSSMFKKVLLGDFMKS